MRGLARDSRSPDSQSRRGSSRRAASAVLASWLLSPSSFSLYIFLSFLSLSRSLAARFPLARSTRLILSPCLRVSFLLIAFVLYTFSLPPLRTEVVYSRAVCPEVALPCTWIPIYAQIPDLSWPRKYLDAGVSRILLLRGTPQYWDYISRKKKAHGYRFYSLFILFYEAEMATYQNVKHWLILIFNSG